MEISDEQLENYSVWAYIIFLLAIAVYAAYYLLTYHTPLI